MWYTIVNKFSTERLPTIYKTREAAETAASTLNAEYCEARYAVCYY